MKIRCRSNELEEFLKERLELLGIMPEQFDAEILEMTVQPGGLTITETGLHYANFKYRQVLYFERLPKSRLALLALLIQNYIDRFDDVRSKFDLPEFKLETISLDRGLTVDVDVTIDFVDPVYLVPTDGGPIEFEGVEYDAGDYDLHIAEVLDSVDEYIEH